MTNKIKIWFHQSDMEGTNHIRWVYDREQLQAVSHDNWFGPFKTFTQCRNDAVAYHKSDIDCGRRAMEQTKNIKYKDVK